MGEADASGVRLIQPIMHLYVFLSSNDPLLIMKNDVVLRFLLRFFTEFVENLHEQYGDTILEFRAPKFTVHIEIPNRALEVETWVNFLAVDLEINKRSDPKA